MGGLIKKIFNSILILLGIGLLVAAFGFGLMFMFKISIFGYTFGSQDTRTEKTVEITGLKEIDIETENSNIVFYNSDQINKVSIVCIQNFQGIIKDNVKNITFKDDLYVNSDGILKIAFNEPSGLFLKNDNKISICLPQGFELEKLSIKTGAKDVSFGAPSNNFTVKDLSVISTRKSFLRPGVTLSNKLIVRNDIYLETFAGRITVDASIGRNVTIKSHSSSIVFNKSILGDLTISGDYPSVEVGQITQGQMDAIENDKNFDLSSITQYDVNGNIVVTECQGGKLTVTGDIKEFVYINSPLLQIWANNVLKGLNCVSGANDIRVYGSLASGDVGRNCIINNGDSHLFVNNNYANLEVNADKNGVNITNSHNNLLITNNNYGTFVSFADGTSDKTLKVTQKKGKITAKNIYGTVELNAETSDIDVEFVKVNGNNTLKAKYNINVNVKDGEIYTLQAKGKSASIDINTGSVIVKDWNNAPTDANGWKVITKNINTSVETELANKIVAWSTENGTITVKAVAE